MGKGGRNRRPDVAKVQTFLGRTGHLDLDRTEGPTGYMGTPVDQAIRDFQKDNNLTVDGVLLPKGETIGALKGILSGESEEKTAEPDYSAYRPKSADDRPYQTLKYDPRQDSPPIPPEPDHGDYVRDPKTGILREKTKAEKNADVAPLSEQPGSDQPSAPSEAPVQSTGSENWPPAQGLDSPPPRDANPISDRFTQIYSDLARREGDLNTNPNDHGGITNFGISQRALDAYHRQNDSDYPKDARDFTPEMARAFIREQYYDRYRLDEIKDTEAARHMLDAVVQHGPNQATAWLQGELNEKFVANLTEDGVLGSKTLSALNQLSPKDLEALNKGMVEQRVDFMRDLANKDPTQRDFLGGWIKRAESFAPGARPAHKR